LYFVCSLFDLSAMTFTAPAVADKDRYRAQTVATGKRRRPQPYLFMQPENMPSSAAHHVVLSRGTLPPNAMISVQ
jgi:hypothetical protein